MEMFLFVRLLLLLFSLLIAMITMLTVTGERGTDRDRVRHTEKKI